MSEEYISFVLSNGEVVTAERPHLVGGVVDLSDGYTTARSNPNKTGGIAGVWILPGMEEPPVKWETAWQDRHGNTHTVTTIPTARELASQTLLRAALDRHVFQVNMMQNAYPPLPANHR